MGTITEKMSYLKETKQAIRTAIEEKGVSVADTDTFRSYASKIGTIIGNISTKVAPKYVSFYNCKDATIDLSWLDTSNIKSMSYMFDGCNKVRSLDLSKFNTSNVYSFECMFSGCDSLESIDLSMLDGSSITATSLMFNYCTKLESIDISNWDLTDKVKLNNAVNMFNYCGSNLSSPTTVYVKNEAMQQWILSTENVPSNWSTSNVIIKNNLLSLLEANAEYVTFEGSGATVTFNNDNTLTVSADGTSGWGVNIAQPNLTLEAGKTYTLSCNNMLDSTWISLNNEQDIMIRRGAPSKEFTPASNIVNPTVVIWVSSGVVYDNVKWNIKLIENI